MLQNIFKKKFNKIILIIICVLGARIGYYFVYENNKAKDNNDFLKNKVLVTKIIDGDTIIVNNGYIIRLLGIDTDEYNKPCYNAAKNYLEDNILNKYVVLESDIHNKDKYDRYLRYLFLNNQNINVQLVNNGLAVSYFLHQDLKYRQKIINAENFAISERIGCKWEHLK